jgi:hypothetical protein
LLLSTGTPDLSGAFDVDGKLSNILLQDLNLNEDEIYRLRKTDDWDHGRNPQFSAILTIRAPPGDHVRRKWRRVAGYRAIGLQ